MEQRLAQRLVQGQDWDSSTNAVHEKDQAINKLETQVEEQVSRCSTKPGGGGL